MEVDTVSHPHQLPNRRATGERMRKIRGLACKLRNLHVTHVEKSDFGMRFAESLKTSITVSAGHSVVTFNMLMPNPAFSASRPCGIGDLHAKPRISCKIHGGIGNLRKLHSEFHAFDARIR